jgi:hypothetical protein
VRRRQGDDRTACLLLHLHHGGEQDLCFGNEAITKQDSEGFLPHGLPSAEHGVAQALGLALTDLGDGTQFGSVVNRFQLVVVAFELQYSRQAGSAVEVVLKCPLAAASDH